MTISLQQQDKIDFDQRVSIDLKQLFEKRDGGHLLAERLNNIIKDEDIITKEDRKSNFGVSANAYYETAGTYNVDASVNVRKKRHSFSFAGSRNFFDGFSTDTLRSQAWKP